MFILRFVLLNGTVGMMTITGSASQMPARDKQRVEDLTRLIRSDTDFPPPDRPTAVTLLLAGTKHGKNATTPPLQRYRLPTNSQFSWVFN